jgi:hypothetical protein
MYAGRNCIDDVKAAENPSLKYLIASRGRRRYWHCCQYDLKTPGCRQLLLIMLSRYSRLGLRLIVRREPDASDEHLARLQGRSRRKCFISLKMEATFSSETSDAFHTTWRQTQKRCLEPTITGECSLSFFFLGPYSVGGPTPIEERLNFLFQSALVKSNA